MTVNNATTVTDPKIAELQATLEGLLAKDTACTYAGTLPANYLRAAKANGLAHNHPSSMIGLPTTRELGAFSLVLMHLARHNSGNGRAPLTPAQLDTYAQAALSRFSIISEETDRLNFRIRVQEAFQAAIQPEALLEFILDKGKTLRLDEAIPGKLAKAFDENATPEAARIYNGLLSELGSKQVITINQRAIDDIVQQQAASALAAGTISETQLLQLRLAVQDIVGEAIARQEIEAARETMAPKTNVIPTCGHNVPTEPRRDWTERTAKTVHEPAGASRG